MDDQPDLPDESQFNEDDDLSGLPEPDGELQDSALDPATFVDDDPEDGAQ